MHLTVKKKKLYFITAAFSILLLAGCSKNQEFDMRPNLNAANDQILANRPFLYVFQILVKAAGDSLLQTTLHATIDGANVSLDSKKQKYIFSFQGQKSDDEQRPAELGFPLLNPSRMPKLVLFLNSRFTAQSNRTRFFI